MLDRVSSEQEIYQTQLKDMNYLKQENSHLATIARQIAPYITSIDAVTKQIDPRYRTAIYFFFFSGDIHVHDNATFIVFFLFFSYTCNSLCVQ